MKTSNFSILALALIMLNSCTENIDFELNTEKSRIVVEGTITNQRIKHLIKITKTTSFYESEEAPKVENANVEISDGINKWVCIEENPGEYFSPEVAFETSKTYTLSIDYKGVKYSGSDYMNPIATVDSLALVEAEGLFFEKDPLDEFFNLVLFAKERDEVGDQYLWKYQVKQPDVNPIFTERSPNYVDWVFTTDEFINGNSPENGWPIFQFIDAKEIPPGSVVKIQMFGISKAYYEYLDALGKAVFRGGLFDGPPANVPTNMDNGALGFFATNSLSEAETTRPN